MICQICGKSVALHPNKKVGEHSVKRHVCEPRPEEVAFKNWLYSDPKHKFARTRDAFMAGFAAGYSL